MPVELLMNMISSASCPADCQTYQVSEDMSRVIENFVLYTHITVTDQQLAMTEGKACIGFLLDPPHYYSFSAGKKERLQTEAYMSGTLLENTYIKKPAPMQKLLLVRFTDAGLYQILHKPLSAFRQQCSYNLQEVFGQEVTVLLQAIKLEEVVENKVRLIEDFFRKRMSPSFPENNKLKQAIHAIRKSKGQIRIEEITEALQVNYKWLERKFQRYLGSSPKEFARNCRFLYAYHELTVAGRKDLLTVALNHGYYDAYHFIKDYKKFTGCTPSGDEFTN